MIEYNIPIIVLKDDYLINLDTTIVSETIDNFNNVDIINGILSSNKREDITNTMYLHKDICIEYIENISEPSVKVPNDSSFRYIIKENNTYKFLKKNPKKTKILIKEEVESLLGTTYLNNSGTIAKQVYTEDNTYLSFSFPYCGIEKGNSYFFYVNTSGQISNLECDVDYVSGTLYTEQIPDLLFVFGVFNIIPLKIIPKGSTKIEEPFSGFYTIKNLPNNNYFDITTIDDNSIILHCLKEVVATIPTNTTTYNIDGVRIKPGQSFFIEKNEVLLVDKLMNPDEKNIEYLSKITEIKNQLDDSLKNDYVYINKKTNSNYILSVIDKENHNTFMKQTPIIIKFF